MRKAYYLRQIISILAIAVFSALAQSAVVEEYVGNANALVMKRIAAKDVAVLATAFEANLITAQLASGRRIVTVRKKDETLFPALDWFGLKDRDVVERVNGTAPRNQESVLEPLRGLKPDGEFTLSILRDDKRRVHVLRAYGNDSPQNEAKTAPPGEDVRVIQEDVLEAEFEKHDPWELLVAAAPVLARDADGNVIGVTSSTIGDIPLARMLGIQSGDIVQSVNGYPITSELAIINLVNQLDGERAFIAKVLRNGKPITLRYRVE